MDKVAGLGAVHAGEVKLVDQARFQGRPATVIVVQATPAQPGTVYAAGARLFRVPRRHPGHGTIPAVPLTFRAGASRAPWIRTSGTCEP